MAIFIDYNSNQNLSTLMIIKSILTRTLTSILPLATRPFTTIKETLSTGATITLQQKGPFSIQKSIERCSPLMRQILSKRIVKQEKSGQVKAKPKKQDAQEQTMQNSSTNKHDLSNFRHMLAGPLLSEANLDKFCIKKECPLVVDIKYDGQRTLISYQKGESLQMISRNGKTQDEFYKKLNETIRQQLQNTDIQSIKLDGEIVAISKDTLAPLPFGQLLKQKKYKNPQANTSQSQDSNIILLVYIFDVLEKDGNNLLQTELIQRRKLIPTINIFRPAQHQIIHFPEQRAKIFQFFRKALQRKYEGVIIKGSKDLYYTNDSRTYWKKLKKGFANNRDAKVANIQLDLIVMGANKGKGNKNSKQLTSYLVGAKYQGKIFPISNLGTGFTKEMHKILTQFIDSKKIIVEKVPEEYEMGGVKIDCYFKPQLVFEVHAQELSQSPLYKLGGGEFGGLSLRFPVFKGIRQDKSVEQATKGEEILELSKSCNFNLSS